MRNNKNITVAFWCDLHKKIRETPESERKLLGEDDLKEMFGEDDWKEKVKDITEKAIEKGISKKPKAFYAQIN